jgi:hypothetical protein
MPDKVAGRLLVAQHCHRAGFWSTQYALVEAQVSFCDPMPGEFVQSGVAPGCECVPHRFITRERHHRISEGFGIERIDK